MRQLQQTTARAPDKIQWSGGHVLCSGFWKNSRERLLTEIEDGNQIASATDSALFDSFGHGLGN